VSLGDQAVELGHGGWIGEAEDCIQGVHFGVDWLTGEDAFVAVIDEPDVAGGRADGVEKGVAIGEVGALRDPAARLIDMSY
jgi:hypothetical protein